MGAEQDQDIDRAAIAERAQRSAEQAALRKVRKTLDRIGEDAAGERRALRKILVLCAILAALGAWVAWQLLFGERGMPKSPPLQLPAKIQDRS